MIITNAKYTKFEGDTENSAIVVTIDGIKSSVPISEGNKDYVEIMKQVAAGTITIAAAD
tara:strand:+ start:382 stop:558 length:177 start_codon:yes stop_codon:yes gene_type:complete